MRERYDDPDNEPAHDDVPEPHRRHSRDRHRPDRAGEARYRYQPAAGGHRYEAGRLNQARGPQARLGSLAPRAGISLIFGAAVLGSVVTIAAGHAPGTLLGWFLVTGTAAAALTVERRRGHLLIPMPAFAYLAAGVAAGLLHDRAQAASKTALAISAARSIASGFLPMTAATIIAALICAARYLAATRAATRSARTSSWP